MIYVKNILGRKNASLYFFYTERSGMCINFSQKYDFYALIASWTEGGGMRQGCRRRGLVEGRCVESDEAKRAVFRRL